MMYIGPEVIVPVTFLTMIPVTVIGFPIARAWARRLDRKPVTPELPHEVLDRLERMEQAIDAIAVEVERISEGQRFTTQLLAGRGEGGAALAAGDAGAGDVARVARDTGAAGR